MDSETSCTYEELASDYKSTLDSEMWSMHCIQNSYINEIFKTDEIPIYLKDDTMDDKDRSETDLPIIDATEMEEMIAEVLFSTPKKYDGRLYELARTKRDSLFVSMSTYGYKYLAFTLPGCLLCENGDQISLYVPQRLLKKITQDCKARGIQCEITGSKSSDIYHRVHISSELDALCRCVCETSKARLVKPALTPIFEDGFQKYYPVKSTMYVILNSNRRIESPTGSGDSIIFRDKRQIKVVVLNIEKS